MSRLRLSVPLLLIVALLTMLIGCIPGQTRYQDIGSGGGEFDVKMLAKSDMSRVAELGQREVLKSLRKMMVHLYNANPKQLNRGRSEGETKYTVQSSVKRIFGQQMRWNFPEFGGVRGNQILHLTFDKDYKGDRVLAFTAALVSMTMRSYNGTTQLYMLDQLDPQKIYNSARNFEVALKMVDIYPYLKQSGSRHITTMIGRATANQDLIAVLVADHLNRQITSVAQSVVTTLLLPI